MLLLCALFTSITTFAADDEHREVTPTPFRPLADGSLIQKSTNDQLFVHPFVTERLMETIYYLNKRSYIVSSRRHSNVDYVHEKLLQNNAECLLPNGTRLYCHRPFAGVHGLGEPDVGLKMRFTYKLLGCAVQAQQELDYAGFVAMQRANDEIPPLLFIVFRGTQANEFENAHGLCGPSALTNVEATKDAMPNRIIQSKDKLSFHRGYLKKYLSLRHSLLGDCKELIGNLSDEDGKRLIVIVTGHSQGGGLAQIAALDVVDKLGEYCFGDDFDNVSNPHFFVLPISAPNVVGNVYTQHYYHDRVGYDNIARIANLFDIVPYACLSTNWLRISWISKCFPIEVGFYPVGHFCPDDTLSVISRCFVDNKDFEANRVFIIQHMARGLMHSLRSRQSHEHYCNWYCDKFMALYHYVKAAKLMGGKANFINVNHYIGPKGFNPQLPTTTLKRAVRNGKVLEGMLEHDEMVSYEQAYGFLIHNMNKPHRKKNEVETFSSIWSSQEPSVSGKNSTSGIRLKSQHLSTSPSSGCARRTRSSSCTSVHPQMLSTLASTNDMVDPQSSLSPSPTFTQRSCSSSQASFTTSVSISLNPLEPPKLDPDGGGHMQRLVLSPSPLVVPALPCISHSISSINTGPGEFAPLSFQSQPFIYKRTFDAEALMKSAPTMSHAPYSSVNLTPQSPSHAKVQLRFFLDTPRPEQSPPPFIPSDTVLGQSSSVSHSQNPSDESISNQPLVILVPYDSKIQPPCSQISSLAPKIYRSQSPVVIDNTLVEGDCLDSKVNDEV
jgi:hypothetical protein